MTQHERKITIILACLDEIIDRKEWRQFVKRVNEEEIPISQKAQKAK